MLWPVDEATGRLLDHDRRRDWLQNGWSLRFQDADTLIRDGVGAAGQACRWDSVPFATVETDLATEYDGAPDQPA